MLESLVNAPMNRLDIMNRQRVAVRPMGVFVFINETDYFYYFKNITIYSWFTRKNVFVHVCHGEILGARDNA